MPDPFTGIPADIQAFRDGWTEITDHGHPYEVVLARDFSDDYPCPENLWDFLYTRWYRSRFNLSNDKSFAHFVPPVSGRHDIIIMDSRR
ncbi:hypothetical protein IV203_015125 [Nitzschia inconspicua]|uniref:Uncharacterized protein n=1 Tax=Nitzschia inconspicua TaxID=303405 RepID=A0A9K3LC45_9STRA|nr:hypothetical protein IV203_015125 [Nitzschia inconspicua]